MLFLSLNSEKKQNFESEGFTPGETLTHYNEYDTAMMPPSYFLLPAEKDTKYCFSIFV